MPPRAIRLCSAVLLGAAVGVSPAAGFGAGAGPDPSPAVDPGSAIAGVRMHPGTGVCTADLDNGVRIRHRAMTDPDDPDRVLLRLVLLGGAIEETAASAGRTEAAAAVWLAGVEVPSSWRVRAEATLDALELRLDAPGDDLDAALAFLADRLRPGAPGPDAEALDAWRAELAEKRRAAEASPAMALAVALSPRLTPPRCAAAGLLSESAAEAIAPTTARAWLDELRSARPATVVIVGPAERERALLAAEQAFARLPRRPVPTGAFLDPFRAAPPPSETIDAALATRGTDADGPGRGDGSAAVVMVGGFGADAWELRPLRALTAGASLVAERVERRLADVGDGPRVWGGPGGAWATYPGWGLLMVQAAVPAERADEAAGVIAEELDRFAREGPTPTELAEVRRRMAEWTVRANALPRAWADRLGRLDRWPATLDDIVAMRSEYQSLGAAELREAVDRAWNEGPRVRAIARPQDGLPNGP